MSDALLKNTFQKISPAYELVADVTVATATTQVDFSGLNFGKDDDLLLVSGVVNAIASDVALNLYVNNNTTATNYYTQVLTSDATSVTSVRVNVMRSLNLTPSDTSIAYHKIKLTNNGYCVFQTDATRRIPSSPLSTNYFATTTFTLTSITQLTVLANTTNAIGVGSRFQLYRLKAKKVADIIVSSATTQVDITGLSIDKDSEYMLVSDWVNPIASTSYLSMYFNDNVTPANYHYQVLVAFSTTVIGGRNNFSLISQNSGSLKTFSISNIKLTNNGYGITQASECRDYGSGIMAEKNYQTTTFTMTSITKLSIVSSVANAIGIGSRFTLYKMR